jgi:acylpyruvate hydrolase
MLSSLPLSNALEVGMRLVSFLEGGHPSVGIETHDGIVCLADIDPGLPGDMAALLALGPATLERLAGTLEGATIRTRNIELSQLLPIVPRPGKIICLGLNYVAHAKEGNMPIPEHPVVFLRTTTSLLPPNHPHNMVSFSSALDYEAELAVIIGTGGRNIPRDEALAHVAGYSVFNDLTYRDLQFRGPQWTLGKNVDGTGPLGPVLVTTVDLPKGAAGLRISTRINGETVQDGNTSDMIFDVATTIASLSEVMTLIPGDVIVTGTPAGVGAARKPPLWLRPGDVCEVEIDGIGKLSTQILAPSEP